MVFAVERFIAQPLWWNALVTVVTDMPVLAASGRSCWCGLDDSGGDWWAGGAVWTALSLDFVGVCSCGTVWTHGHVTGDGQGHGTLALAARSLVPCRVHLNECAIVEFASVDGSACAAGSIVGIVVDEFVVIITLDEAMFIACLHAVLTTLAQVAFALLPSLRRILVAFTCGWCGGLDNRAGSGGHWTVLFVAAVRAVLSAIADPLHGDALFLALEFRWTLLVAYWTAFSVLVDQLVAVGALQRWAQVLHAFRRTLAVLTRAFLARVGLPDVSDVQALVINRASRALLWRCGGGVGWFGSRLVASILAFDIG